MRIKTGKPSRKESGYMNRIKLNVLALFFVLLMHLSLSAQAWEVKNPTETIFSQNTYPISAIDPSILTNAQGSFYPGLRGSNQLIIYTPLFGVRTGTNEFGSEAIVNGNLVTAISGADSIIPCDGLVISGHGKAKKWMNENIIVGAKVYVNKDAKTLTVYITSASYLFGAKEKIKEAQDIMGYYKQT